MAGRIFVTILLLGITIAQASKNGFCNLVWSDEFNNAEVAGHWLKESTCKGGGNNEMQCYTTRSKNVFTQNGDLVLKAYRETYSGSWDGCTDNEGCTWTKPYTSGRVSTIRSNSWTYGRFETRAKLPSGYQLWPAIWMMPVDYRYGGWAASGEIDIMEARGERPWDVSGTLHHGAGWPNNIYTTSGDKSIGVDFSKEFHIFTVEWTRDYIKWYIDDVLTQNYDLNRWWNNTWSGAYTARGQPFDQRFHFILNLAVGGSFFGGAAPVTDAQAAAWGSNEMRVDYVRVYQQGGNCGSVQVPTPAPAPVPTQAADNNGRPVDTPATPGKCNGQGYDSRSYSCAVNNRGQEVLCPKDYSACGQQCFLARDFCCLNGALVTKLLCPATPVAVTPATPATSAAPAQPAQPQTPGYCNGQGYSPATYDCTTNENGQKVLCSRGSQSCGGACFDPNSYCCKSGNLRQKGQC